MNKSKEGRINKIFRTLLVALFFCVTGGAFVLAETLPEMNQSTEPFRTYNFINNETVTLDSDMGVTGGGVFTVNGIDKNSNTIDFNNYSGFVITRIQTTLNLNNLTITGAKSTVGAFLYNVSSDSQVTLTNLNITSNSVNTSDNAYGGAIYTFNPITLTNVSLRGNSATTTGTDTVAQGGAIYARDSVNMIADSDNVVIVDNTTADSNGTDNNAIYMANSNSTLNIQARNNGQMDIQDNINGASGYRVNITGDGTGTVGLNDSIRNAGEINVSNVNVSMADGVVKNHELNNLNLGDNVNFTVDADLANQTADTITAQNGTGTLYLTGLNIISSSTENEVKIQILKDAGNIVLNIDNLSSSIYTEVEATMYNSSILADSLTLGTTDTANDSIVITGQKDVLYEMVRDNNPLHTIKNFIFNTSNEYNLTRDLEESPQETILNIYNTSTAESGVINANGHSMFKLTNPVTSVTLNDITIKNAHADTNGSVVSLSNNTATFNATNSTLTNNTSDGNGGAIYVNRGSVNVDTSTLSQNSAGGSGGAIYVNNGNVSLRNSDISSNSATENGGAINAANNSTVEITNSGIRNNTSGGNGGAINAANNSTVSITNSNIENNSSTGNGGAINSMGGSVVEVTNTDIKNNTASGRGGAIYTNGNVVINANRATTTIEGNTDSTGSNAIYSGAGGNVTLNVTNGGRINLNDKVSGDKGYSLNVTGSSNGNVNVNNNIENANITQSGATVNLAHDNLLSGNSYNANGGTLNMVNGEVGNTDFTDFSSSGRTNFKADVDLSNKRMDRISSASYHNVTGTVNVNRMHLLSDAKGRQTRVYFADSPLRHHVTTPIKTLASRVYRYLVTYSPEDGYFEFMRGDSNDYKSFDQSLLAAPVAQQFAYMNQLQNYQAAMYHNDTYMSLPKNVRLNSIRNGISSEDFDSTTASHLTIPEERKSIWVRPYASFESVPLKHGPKVSSINYGTLAGGESDMMQLGHGFTLVYGGFLSYNGNSYHYSNVHSTMQGATLGGIVYLYKGNFFNTLTANVGWMINDNDTEYGSDTMNIIMSGFADKIGYNIEIAKGKVIIQPSLMFGYTFVHTDDYTTSNGLKIDSEPLHALHFIPGIKVIGNLANGWQPYACINIVANFIDKSRITVSDIQLPEMSIDPYVEYGIGLQKRWTDKYSGFAQATVRNGGRRGAALLFGFRCMLGRLKTTVITKHEDAKPKRIKFKERKKPEITVEPVKKRIATKPKQPRVKHQKAKGKKWFAFNFKNIFKREKKQVLYQYNTDVSAKVVTDVYNDGVIIRSLDGMKSEKMSVYADNGHANPADNKGTIKAEKDVKVQQTVKTVKTVNPVEKQTTKSKTTVQKTAKQNVKPSVKTETKKTVEQKTVKKSAVQKTKTDNKSQVKTVSPKPQPKKEVKTQKTEQIKQTPKQEVKKPVEKTVTPKVQPKTSVKPVKSEPVKAAPKQEVKKPVVKTVAPKVQEKPQVKADTMKPQQKVEVKKPVVKQEQKKAVQPKVQTQKQNVPNVQTVKPNPVAVQKFEPNTDGIKPYTKMIEGNESRTQRMLKKQTKPNEFDDFNLEIIDIKF